MRNFRLLLVTLLISSLLAPQVLAAADIPAETEVQAETPSPVITAGSPSGGTGRLSTVTSVPSTVYPTGTYHVGTDIPAGEYVLLSDHTDSYNAYIIYEDASENAAYVDYNMFDYNAIIKIEDGQVLNLKGSTASPISEMPEIDYFYGTMYKVGYHIPAGTYQLKGLDSSSYGVAYVLSYPSDNYDVVEDYTYVDDTAAVTVRDGQYLQLSDCILTDTAPASSVAKDHGRPATSWYDDWTSSEDAATDDTQRTSLITAGTLIPGLPTTTSVPSTAYEDGTYEGGADIPAGEYVLLGNDRDSTDYSDGSQYIISTVRDPENADQVVDYSSFEYNAIIKVEEGQFLTMENCTASPIDQVPKIDYRKGEHFKIGYQIPAGTYHFKLDGSYGFAYVLSAPARQVRDVVTYETMSSYSTTATLTLEEGQYLYLLGCDFTNGTENEGSKPAGPGGEGTDSSTSSNIDYLRRMFGYEEEKTTSKVITAPRTGQALTATTSTPSTVYPEGTYEAGTDIPAGEYILLASDSADSPDGYSNVCGYVISTVRETETYGDIIDYNNFSYNAIVHVSEGQFLYMLGCTASPVDEVPQLDYKKGEMYKVGLQLPAGTYRLKYSGNSYYRGSAYILSHPSDNYEDVIESYSVTDEEGVVVTVTNGQYLQLRYCVVAEVLDYDDSSTGPAFAPVKDSQE